MSTATITAGRSTRSSPTFPTVSGPGHDRAVIILGIETSCDETAVAVVEDGRTIRSNLISSQVDLHRRFGGVVPELASRAHVEILNPLLDEALAQADVRFRDLDAVAVTSGPGLIGAL